MRPREPRPAAQGRARAGGGGVPESDGRQPDLCGRRGPVPHQASGCVRSGNQAEDHRQ